MPSQHATEAVVTSVALPACRDTDDSLDLNQHTALRGKQLYTKCTHCEELLQQLQDACLPCKAGKLSSGRGNAVECSHGQAQCRDVISCSFLALLARQLLPCIQASLS